jgi:hypothetical protein
MYRIFAFDGIEIPDYDADHNMGTGAALTSFQQLPNGFFDNYGTADSPQGIRPIVARGRILHDTAAEMRTTLDALRKKIGKRGKLTVQFDDGSLRWQWARLVDVDIPADKQFRLMSDFTLTWITASQIWYGVVTTSDEWTWGDLAWTFGDGTAEIGESGYSTTLTATGATGTAPPSGGTSQSFTLSNGGNKTATNISITVTAGTTAVTACKFTNDTTGDTFYFSASVSAGNVLVINCGAMAVTNNASNAYSSFVPGNRAVWFTLAPGDNTITILVNGNTAADGTIAFEYYDHYS